MPDPIVRVVELLEQMNARLATLETFARAGAARSARPLASLGVSDRRRLEALLPHLVGKCPGETVLFARDAYAEISVLPEVLSALFGDGPIDDKNATKALGKLLGRAADSEAQVCGVIVCRGVDDGTGIFWSLRRVS